MAERKVLNKYFPPDFDPRFLAKKEGPKNDQIHLRGMLPMTICCTTCGNYMGRGTKFNCRVENTGDSMRWKGLIVWRFYCRCIACNREMTFLTDPARDHYVTEHGCKSLKELWREELDVNEAADRAKAEEEEGK